MTWWNPKTWFRKKPADPLPEVESIEPNTSPIAPTPFVYVAAPLDKPLGGLTLSEPPAPWIKIVGLSLVDAAALLPGKSIAWHTVPMSLREKLENAPHGCEMIWVELEEWIQ